MSTPATIVDQKLPTVALVGRVNVGKSTLFNRLIGFNKALVSDIPGTTRTRNIDVVNWRGKYFRLIDTGGLTFSDDVPLEKEIIRQTELAIKESDVILFIIDAQEGLMPQERDLARLLNKEKTRTILIANKADNLKWRDAATDREWLKLGLGEPLPLSAINGSGVGDMLDCLYKFLGKVKNNPKVLLEADPIKVALIGKPNVGKSTLFNALIGEERAVISNLPHTTREPHDTLVDVDGQQILFVDTAGIRRKTKVSGLLEREGVEKSLQMVRKADIVLLVLDTNEAIADQDQQLAGLLREHTKSVIIVINKWDLADDNDDAFRNDVKRRIYKSFPHLDFSPIVFVSGKTFYRVHQIFPLIARAWQERHIEIPEDELAEFWKKISHEHRPARGKGTRHPKILGFRQLRTNPPMFEMLIKAKTSLHFSYVHYVENRLRERFGFFGCPLVIKLTKVKR